jgi:hypothetical protein
MQRSLHGARRATLCKTPPHLEVASAAHSFSAIPDRYCRWFLRGRRPQHIGVQQEQQHVPTRARTAGWRAGLRDVFMTTTEGDQAASSCNPTRRRCSPPQEAMTPPAMTRRQVANLSPPGLVPQWREHRASYPKGVPRRPWPEISSTFACEAHPPWQSEDGAACGFWTAEMRREKGMKEAEHSLSRDRVATPKKRATSKPWKKVSRS